VSAVAFRGSTGSTVRDLTDRDLPAVRELLERDPIADVFVSSRIASCGLDPRRLGAHVWGYERGGRLTALCFSGANLWPVQADAEAARAFSDRARKQGRRCSSIVGDADAVLELWRHLARSWGAAREIRSRQPLLAIDHASAVPADPGVRRVRPDELDVLLPASVAMFTEEIGIRPDTGDGGALYRARVAEIIGQGRSLARIDNGRVLFKAEIGAVTDRACQIQGVWVDPQLRGAGIGAAGMAAVVAECLRSVAPIVSLYVNDFNLPARRVYERVGFTQVGTFASVLF
jgi:predicted GNAT family acetyltransferase